MVESGSSPFGARLRHWRRARRLSQLDLAARCATTTRHLSFLETGRSRPSEAMVLRLCDVLDVPLRERNELLEAAGLMAHYPTRSFDAADLAPYRDGIGRLLSAHDPFPGLVLDRHWRVLVANTGATRLFGDVAGHSLVEWMTTAGPELVNDAAMIAVARERLRQQLRENPTDDELARLVALTDELGGAEGPAVGEVAICPTFLIDGHEIGVIGLAARFETPLDVTVAELRIELFFPADLAAADFFRSPPDVATR